MSLRVFVTGGTGLIGSYVVPQLVAAGHTVTTLARSDKSAEKVVAAGATPIRGTHTDLDVLAKAAAEADAVIHLAFNHDLMALPGGPVQACAEDRAAITAICDALLAAGPGRTFINSSGTLGSDGPDETATKPPNPISPRGESEKLTLSYTAKGLRTLNVRLAPVVHGPGSEHPFISVQIALAKKNGYAAYVGDGQQLWPSIHAKDAAALYVAALTNGPAGVNLNGIDEEGIPVKDIAEFIAKKLGGIPTKSLKPEDLTSYGFIGHVMSLGGRTTNELTKKWTGWAPKEYGLFKELENYTSFSH